MGVRQLRKTVFFAICSPFLLVATVQAADLPAFPGAEGFGSTTPGGRGGAVIKVTNLNDSGPGSFHAACSSNGPRIVVFDVSGVITDQVVTVDHGDITIAGQTAPGGGITLDGKLFAGGSLQNVVVRFLRVRPLSVAADDAVRFSGCGNVVFDHVSCCWAFDEVMDFHYATNFSLQWCTIEESAEPTPGHNYAFICGEGDRASIHHNLFAHHRARCPNINHGPADIRNNVVYNFRDGLTQYTGVSGNFNIVGNYYRRGQNDPDIFPFDFNDGAGYFMRNNYIDGIGMVQNPWAEAYKLHGLVYYHTCGTNLAAEVPMPWVTIYHPLRAYNLVLEAAGCLPHDTVTRRTIREVEDELGLWGMHVPADLMEGLERGAAPYPDGDNDGMPNAWETAHGLNPGNGADHVTVMPTRYTAIEEYCKDEPSGGERDLVRRTRVLQLPQ